MSPLVSAFGGAPVGSDDEVAAMITATTDAPFLPAVVTSSLLGWMNADVEPIAGSALRTLQLAPEKASVVATAPGPITLATAARAMAHPAHRTLLAVEALVRWMQRFRDQVEGHRGDVELVVVLDDPALAAIGPGVEVPESYRSIAAEAIAEVVASAPVPVAIRCEEDTDWAVVAAARPAFVAWNTHALASGFDDSTDELAAAAGDGMRIMWGTIGTEPGTTEHEHVTVDRYRTALAKLVVAGAPLAAVRDDAWFTPAGTLERLDLVQARRVMQQVAVVAGHADE